MLDDYNDCWSYTVRFFFLSFLINNLLSIIFMIIYILSKSSLILEQNLLDFKDLIIRYKLLWSIVALYRSIFLQKLKDTNIEPLLDSNLIITNNFEIKRMSLLVRSLKQAYFLIMKDLSNSHKWPLFVYYFS